ncbi:MAG TPA: barstar family protein [Terriglobales bacterium]|nr:barstar family protein [Terriglobales bacterium]
MRTILLDARGWATRDDFYDAVFREVGAPAWHGRNFNALADSIATGSINKIEVPYSIKLKNLHSAAPVVRDLVQDFMQLIHDLAAKGCPVAIEIID